MGTPDKKLDQPAVDKEGLKARLVAVEEQSTGNIVALGRELVRSGVIRVEDIGAIVRIVSRRF